MLAIGAPSCKTRGLTQAVSLRGILASARLEMSAADPGSTEHESR
jgi:hypothetical protein